MNRHKISTSNFSCERVRVNDPTVRPAEYRLYITRRSDGAERVGESATILKLIWGVARTDAANLDVLLHHAFRLCMSPSRGGLVYWSRMLAAEARERRAERMEARERSKMKAA